MKKLSLLILMTLFIVTFNFAQKTYAIVGFHKLEPGHTLQEAIALEKEWKLVHQARKDAGIITNWAIFSVRGGLKTKDVDFDYISVNYGSDLDKMNNAPANFTENFMKANPSYSDIFERTGKVQKIIRQVINVSEAIVGEFQPDQILVFESMKVEPKNNNAYREFEKTMAKVQEDRIKAGIITRWTCWRQLIPAMYNGSTYFSTTNAYPNFASMEKGGYTDESAKKHFGMSSNDVINKAATLRSIESTWIGSLAVKL
jgi:hypothetical protein